MSSLSSREHKRIFENLVDETNGAALYDAVAAAEQDARLAEVEECGSFVWIDMEESQYVDDTLEVFRAARARHENVGVCLQSYLRRTPADLEALLPLSPAIPTGQRGVSRAGEHCVSEEARHRSRVPRIVRADVPRRIAGVRNA